MDIEHALLSKIIRDEDIAVAVDHKVNEEWFRDDAYRRVYQYALDHWQQHGTPPDQDVIGHAFPSYTWTGYSQPIEYYIRQLRRRRRRSLFLDGLQRQAELVQSDDPDAVDAMYEVMRETLLGVEAETSESADRKLGDRYQSIDAYLDALESDPGFMRGISTGFAGIDYVTGGWQPDQLVTLIGLPKALKSSTLLAMALATFHQGRRALFLGFEMSNDEQEQRAISLEAHVGLTAVRDHTWTLTERQAIRNAYVRFGNSPDFILSADIASATTISGVQAKIMEHRPDVVFIDSVYLMNSELPKVEQKSPAAMTDIAQGLKRLAQNVHLPIVVTTQATARRTRQGKLNADSAMWTQAWRQSSDVMLAVERDDPEGADEMIEPVTITLKVLASRSGPRTETTLVWDWRSGTVQEMNSAGFTSAAVVAAANSDD